ncbi:MAG: tRNA (N6-threonylcarbamoyladenosine(37)-N6)-methyltransferase TrmO [Elusimicrobiota bacterium]
MTTSPLQVIGVLRSCFREKFGTPRQPHLVPGATASLKISRQFQPEQSLVGLNGFSHVWLLSYFHLNTNTRFSAKVHPPRLKGETIGLFASRSPHRPSAIGLSVARLVKVENDTIHLSGIDLVDGTPILDVKPYIPGSDSFPEASSGWTAQNEFPTLKVEFSPKSLTDISIAEKRLKTSGLKQLLIDVLSQDLRNPRDKSQKKDGVELGFFLHDFDAHFVVHGDLVTVLELQTGKTMHKKERRTSPKRVALSR